MLFLLLKINKCFTATQTAVRLGAHALNVCFQSVACTSLGPASAIDRQGKCR